MGGGDTAAERGNDGLEWRDKMKREGERGEV